MDFIKYLKQAGVPEHLHAEAVASFEVARLANYDLAPYKWSAPLVMALVVPFLPWEAEHLPRLFRKYDNDISINGDPWKWKQAEDGSWYRAAPLEDTPEVRAKCYWAKGHHPRSRWARYVWLGWRNKASKLAFDLGVPSSLDVEMWGDPLTSRSHEGVKVFRMGQHWQIMACEKRGSFVVRRNVGWKINNIVENQHIQANLTWITWSMVRWKGPK